MPRTPGTRLGPYEIVAPLGAGGMGEVYRAKDTNLDREVAIKVLPAVVAEDRERLARFEREAKVLASLNHPNIAQIYGLEANGDARGLVMELVPGSTLSIPQPLEIALNYARQIAEALEAAHEKGITHRDLKPANIMITPEGVVKVLDFGLASVPSREGASDVANSPTVTMAATQAGVIMGTAAYMSPEQAAGKAVDRRADIWSFGVVLWEILTGTRLFAGETISHTLADVLRAPINFEKLPASVPPPVVELLKRCLDRDLKTRLQAIGEARIAVQKCLTDPKGGTVAPPALVRAAGKLPWVAAALASAAAALFGFGYYSATRPADLKPLVRLDVDLGSSVSLSSARGADAILSPDSTRLVFASQGKLFTRKLDQPKATELPGTAGAFAPFFSPDGQWIAYFDGSKLKKLSLESGEQAILCNAAGVGGGSWGPDGNIIAPLSSASALSRVPSTGGAPTPVTELAPGETHHDWPQVLPGGKAVLFTSYTSVNGFAGSTIEVVSLTDPKGKAGRRKVLQRGGFFGRYAAASHGAGHLAYMNSGTLFAVALDLDALEVRGAPVPVVEQVACNPTFGFAQLDLSGAPSSSGTLLYRSGGVEGNGLVTIQWLDNAGRMQPLLAKPGAYQRPRLSPDGQRLALEIPTGTGPDVWIYNWPRDTMTRLTFDAGVGGLAMSPVWSPDGRYIVFYGKGGIFWTLSNGAGKPQPLTQGKTPQFPWSFTPDTKRLAWIEAKAGGGFGLWTAPVEGDGAGLRSGKPELFIEDAFDERYPMLSPDGRWLAYMSNESGTFQVYVRAFPDRGGKWQISSNGGTYPVWSHDGHELFFRSGDGRVMVAAYTVKGDSLAADQPKVWSEKRIAEQGMLGYASYDVARDGKRMAALMPVETPESQQAQSHVIFLLNFFDELRRKAPLGGK